MGRMRNFAAMLACVACLGLAAPVVAANYPDPVEADYVIKDFTFHDGTTMPELKVHYATIGDPQNPAVLVLHGTMGSHKSMLADGFGGALFGPGQPLDAGRYFLVIPDGIGAGDSSKPSDGMRASFPSYDYDDMVEAQRRLVTDGLGIDHLRAVIGYSMGGMHAWNWATQHPEAMDAAIPLASLPTAMAGRNWLLRRMVIDSIRNDPAWHDGDYNEQPPMVKMANFWNGMATNNGDLGLLSKMPTNAETDAWLDEKLAAAKVGDANDVLFQWNASRSFDPSADLGKIKAHVLVINSADDERNPASLGILEKAMPQIEHGEVYIIPASAETTGHATAGSQAELLAEPLAKFLDGVPAAE